MSLQLSLLPLPACLAIGPGGGWLPLRVAVSREPGLDGLVATGEGLLGVRNAPPMVKAAVGLLARAGEWELLVATAGELVDFGAAATVMVREQAIRVLPVFPGDVRRTESAILAEMAGRGLGGAQRFRGFRGFGPEELATLGADQAQQVYSSSDWRRTLLGHCLGEGVSAPMPAGDGAVRIPLALLGHLACGPADLLSAIEELGGRVVYDEYMQLAAELVAAPEPFTALAESPLVMGLAARTRALGVRGAAAAAAVLVTEPFCAHALEEVWFRRALGMPLLALEVEGPGPMSAGQRLRLEAFMAGLRQRGKGR